MSLIDLLENTKKAAALLTPFLTSPLPLYKQLKSDNLSLTEYLEKIDPTPKDESGKPLIQLDAFERLLMLNEVKLSGPGSFTLEMLHKQVEYLMPELVLREIKAGMTVDPLYDPTDCIAVSVPSKATYNPLYIPNQVRNTVQTRRDKSLGARSSSKGGEFPVVSISRREKTIQVEDQGKQIEAPYNLIKDYGWEDFAVFLRLIGAQLASDDLQDIYDIGIVGDGTVGAATNTFAGVAGTLAYTDLIRNWTSFGPPFKMSRVLAPVQSLETILAMAQFQDPEAGFEFQRTGNPVTPMGAKLKQIDTVPGSTPVGTVIVTLDHRFAIREINNEPLMVESEAIIARKYEKAVVSQAKRFCVVADGALKRIVWT